MNDNIKFHGEQRLKRYISLLILSWTIIVAGSLTMNLIQNNTSFDELAFSQARENFNKDSAFRYWGTSHGGVYVPMNKRTPPNPYLSHIPDREIVKPSGDTLTLMNPAYMVRQMNEDYSELYGVEGHITSLKLLRPENAPDEWERNALNAFESGETEMTEFAEINGEPYLRLMRPLSIKQGCLKCHGHQGYTVGDIRGGVGIALPLKELNNHEQRHASVIYMGHSVIWLIGLIGLYLGSRRVMADINIRRQSEREREELVDKLEATLIELEKTLKGLIPNCANCKKMRDDEGYWQNVERYIEEHSSASFSHGICPDCMKELYPEVWEKIQKRKADQPEQ